MGRIPGWYKGRMRNCSICDAWYGEREGKFREQRGMKWVCPECYDSLTDQEREESVSRRIR